MLITIPKGTSTTEITTREVRTNAWVWRYRILDGQNAAAVAEGQMVHVMHEYASRGSVAIPPDVRIGLRNV